MKKLTAIGIVLLFVVGLVPILWLHPGFIISNGDNIPPSLNADKAFSSSTNMWSPDYLGYASPNPAYLFDTYFAALLGILGVSVGLVQIIIQVLLYMGSGFSMYFFSKTIYPDHKIAPFFAAFFYMFNFFVLNSRFNLGFAWLYTFLPLLLALFVRTMNATYREDKKSSNTGIICFGLVSVLALSVASVNPANIALFLLAMSVFAVYFLIKHKKNLLPFLLVVGKMAAVTIPINIWWMYPMLNTFIFSPAGLNSQVNVASWSWTHARASFLNLFWFNGTWGWLPEYVPVIFNYYLNPIVAVLTFVPFLTAGAALLFKSNKSRFNAFIMGCILFFLFLAKGVHDPLSDLPLYQISLMNMFREPASKFTLLIIPFIALLIGYSAESILNIKSLHVKSKIRPNRLKSIKVSVLLFLAFSFLISSFPLLSGFEPSSSYIQIPQYWYQATDWINSQPGDWKVLLTPLNDYYQMNYTWGYYGSDQLLERLLEKPIISTAALDGYTTNPDTLADLKQIRTSARFDQTVEFKALLDLLNIKYILQRNDIITDSPQRNITSSSALRSFFLEQPYLKLVQHFGCIDIYECSSAKPTISAILPSTVYDTDIQIYTYTTFNKTWDFHYQTDVKDWSNQTLSTQPQANWLINQKNDSLEANMWTTSDGWVTINSPLLPVNNDSSYDIRTVFSATNDTSVNLKIAEYSQNMTLLNIMTVAGLGDNSSDYTVLCTFIPKSDATKSFQIQFWNAIRTNITLSTLTLEKVSVLGTVSTLNMTGLTTLYAPNPKNPAILQVQNISPTKIIVTANATQPFVLVSGQVLDRFWVADVNGQQISPTSLYLGLKGFMINQTGQLTIVLHYKPQDWFNICLTISETVTLFLCIGLLFLYRKKVKDFIKKPNNKIWDPSHEFI